MKEALIDKRTKPHPATGPYNIYKLDIEDICAEAFFVFCPSFILNALSTKYYFKVNNFHS